MGTYSFMDVTATIDGPTGTFSLGYGEATAEEGIVITRASDKNTMTIGSDGEGMHSLHADKSGQITLRYLKTAPINAKLMAMYDAQSLSSALWGKNLIEVSQTVAGDVITGRSCAFKKAPDLRYAKDGDIVEWQFDVIKIDSLLGTY
ncbi:phage structural protein [Burkholderia gladioli]|uniref:phage structural protein n=1 Tax=Burkholderia gladioli TaxID=28095 RepID=UPI00164010AE|nr:phage protein [Burkholderia gladioli]